MKHPRPAAEQAEAFLRALGVECVDALGTLERHLQMVLKANETMNLTAIRDPEDAVRLHLLDSLSGVPLLAEAPAGPLADLGSGPGYPGIPLSVCSGRRVTLVESVGKKATFLREAVAALGLEVDVVNARAEDLARERPAAFAVVTARAVSSLPALVELASPLLVEGGWLIAYKGEVEAAELERGDAVGRRAGLRRLEVRRVVVPDTQARTLVVYERRGRVTVDLPRRPGLAQRNPLA